MRLIGVICNCQKRHKLTAPVFLIGKLYTYKSVKLVQSNWATSVTGGVKTLDGITAAALTGEVIIGKVGDL